MQEIVGDMTGAKRSEAINVLVVDDDLNLLELSDTMLTDLGGLNVETVSSGKEALTLLDSGDFDAVVCDYEMPGMNGIELLMQIRAGGSKVPFILFTGKGREEVAIKALNGGADSYLQKGGDPTSLFIELTHRIHGAVDRRRAEMALLESEHKFRMMVEASPDVIWELDADGMFTYISPRIEDMLGYSPERFMGRSLASIIEMMAVDDDASFDQKVLNRNDFETEFAVRDRNGRNQFIEIRSRPIFDEKGEIRGFRGFVHDITERKETETKIVHSFNLMQYIISHAGSEIFVLDRNMRYLYVSDRFLDDYKLKDRNVLGKNHYDVFPDLPRSVKEVHKRVLEGEVISKANDQYNRDDGTVDWINWDCRPWYESDGTVGGIVLYTDIITEQKNREEELQVNQRLLADAMDLAKLVNWEYDVLRNVFIFNDRFYSFHGSNVEEMGGYEISPERYAKEFVHPDDAYMVAEAVQKAIETKDSDRIFQFEHRIIRRDGAARYVVVRFSVIMSKDGMVVGTKGGNQDITDRIMSENALKRANHRLDILSSITAHDTMNKLAVIWGNLEMVKMRYPDPAIQKMVSNIEKAAASIQTQVKFLQQYNRLGTSAQTLHVLRDVILTVQVPEGVQFQMDIPDVKIFADPMFEKVFANLMDNSIRHGEKVSKISIKTEQQGGELIIVWEDDGAGIPAQDKEYIFEPGFGKNTGYGLFLTREILSITDLKIRENGIFGKGARFEIRVPIGKWHQAK
ncbi:MAG: PAS domain S-box protein [Euryarchaeota archaeon]|nr:PAS domain S-box protein [Euryarchaeota archaeon]